MDDGMSFEEFSAMRKRRAQQQKNEFLEESGGKVDAKENDRRMVEQAAASQPFYRLGSMVQSQEAQLMLVFLIVVDLLSGFYQLYAQAKGWSTPFLHILEYQSGLCLLVYTFEIGMVLVAYKGETFSHLGYSLDIVLVGAMYYGILASEDTSKDNSLATGMRLLNIFRLWRVIRIVNSVIQSNDSTHQQTRMELTEAQEKLESLKLRAKKADQSLKREMDKYRRLEQSFRLQRDELDTMREALQIAAQTVAKVQGLEGIAGFMGEEEKLEFERFVQEQRDLEATEEGEEEGEEFFDEEAVEGEESEGEEAKSLGDYKTASPKEKKGSREPADQRQEVQEGAST